MKSKPQSQKRNRRDSEKTIQRRVSGNNMDTIWRYDGENFGIIDPVSSQKQGSIPDEQATKKYYKWISMYLRIQEKLM